MRSNDKKQEESREESEEERRLNVAALREYDLKVNSSTSFEGTTLDLSPIASGGVSITHGFLPPQLLQKLRSDASQLYQAGSFSLGKMIGGKKESSNIRYRRCDVCDLFDAGNVRDVGEREAREEMFSFMTYLREMIADELGRQLIENMELQYLRYPGDGGFYGRHFDRSEFDGNETAARSVSLLIYLNDRYLHANIYLHKVTDI